MLQEVAPTVYIESSLRIEPTLFEHHHASESSFNSDSPDMVLEQTVNRDSKIKRGIVGGTGMERTRNRWALTTHMMAAATASLKVISGT